MKRLVASLLALSLLILILLAGLGSALAQNYYGQTPASENVLIILDASDSMKLPVDGGRESRMSAAKRVIVNMLGKIPPHVNVGLRVYGDISTRSRAACQATRTLVSVAANNRRQIANHINGIHPLGLTPTSLALKRAIVEDFAPLSGKKSIILVSDGRENCDRDPCDVAREMMSNNVDVTINVVGYGTRDLSEANRQLKCVALTTRGRFYNADTSAQLSDAMGNLFGVKEVRGQILTPTMPKVTAPAAQPAARKPAPKIQELKAY